MLAHDHGRQAEARVELRETLRARHVGGCPSPFRGAGIRGWIATPGGRQSLLRREVQRLGPATVRSGAVSKIFAANGPSGQGQPPGAPRHLGATSDRGFGRASEPLEKGGEEVGTVGGSTPALLYAAGNAFPHFAQNPEERGLLAPHDGQNLSAPAAAAAGGGAPADGFAAAAPAFRCQEISGSNLM